MDLDILKIKGETVTEITGVENHDVIFHCASGRKFRMFHQQDCCESVTIEDVIGDIRDLIGVPMLMAEIVSEEQKEREYGETCTWSFVKFGTVKGYVTFRWYGSSNGYYSETPTFEEVLPKEDW